MIHRRTPSTRTRCHRASHGKPTARIRYRTRLCPGGADSVGTADGRCAAWARMLELIALDKERARLDCLPGALGVSWDRLLFSAKESVYKTWFPLTQRWLGFESADIAIDPREGTFTARLLVEGPLAKGAPLTKLNGRWLADHGLLVTAIVVPA